MVRGPTAGEGYWNQRAKSRRTFAGEWTYMGDKFFRDADGYYHYCGRTDDMFKVSGMWVSPFEVEAALSSHEAVLEAAVIGKEDADGLIKPKAFIVLRDGYAVDERLIETLRVHVKACAGPWKYPRWIDIRPDLPRTATGKLQRFKLRELRKCGACVTRTASRHVLAKTRAAPADNSHRNARARAWHLRLNCRVLHAASNAITWRLSVQVRTRSPSEGKNGGHHSLNAPSPILETILTPWSIVCQFYFV